MLLTLKHEPGALAKVLKSFADKGINLTKVDFRPIYGQPYQNVMNEALHQLSDLVDTFILGFYVHKEVR